MVKVYSAASEPDVGPASLQPGSAVAVSHPEHVDIHLPDGVPVEVVALVDTQVMAVEARPVERVNMLDKQVADLQMDQVRAGKPWYRQMAVMISLGALLFTIAATLFNYVQAKQNNDHNARVELRDLTQRLSQIPIDNINASRTYTNSFQLSQVSGLLQEENALLAKQAEEVMNEIPDSVSSSEYLLVANALVFSNLNDDAVNMVNKAIGVIKDAYDGATVYRFKGQLLFSTGDLSGGRQAFQQALDIFERYPTKNAYFQTITTVQNEYWWASAEYGAGQCAEAKKHIDHATQLLSSLSPQMQQQGSTKQLTAQVQQLNPIIAECSAP
jgi:tetratricopeptide (TPR) repeat protein